MAGASEQAIRIIETAQELAAESDAYGRLLANLATLGYRGHPITKSRAYSVTLARSAGSADSATTRPAWRSRKYGPPSYRLGNKVR